VADGAQRSVQHSGYRLVLVEVRDEVAFVNGRSVVPLAELRSTDFSGCAAGSHVPIRSFRYETQV
jgi:hypothetical protein